MTLGNWKGPGNFMTYDAPTLEVSPELMSLAFWSRPFLFSTQSTSQPQNADSTHSLNIFLREIKIQFFLSQDICISETYINEVLEN